MSDMTTTQATGQPDFMSLYSEILQQFPRSKGKSASPQADMKAALAWKAMIDKELGFDPMTYEAPAKKQWSPKTSVVRLQFGADPWAQNAMDDIDSGDMTSGSIAAMLIEPNTGEVNVNDPTTGKPWANPPTLAQATTAIDAAKAYERERAQNTADEQDYEARQDADPTFGRTQGSTHGQTVLPEGDLDGYEKPSFQYTQNLMDMVSGLSDNPVYQPPSPAAGPASHHAADGSVPHYGPRRSGPPPTMQNPNTPPTGGPMSPPSASLPPTPSTDPAVNLLGDGGSPWHEVKTPRQGNVFQDLALGLHRMTPQFGPSDRQRATDALSSYQEFAAKYGKPVRSQANNAAVQKLLTVMALGQL